PGRERRDARLDEVVHVLRPQHEQVGRQLPARQRGEEPPRPGLRPLEGDAFVEELARAEQVLRHAAVVSLFRGGRQAFRGLGRDTYGGTIDVETTGNLAGAGLDVSGGDRAGGGDITLLSNGTITASGAIKAQGFDGGALAVAAHGDVGQASG